MPWPKPLESATTRIRFDTAADEIADEQDEQTDQRQIVQQLKDPAREGRQPQLVGAALRHRPG